MSETLTSSPISTNNGADAEIVLRERFARGEASILPAMSKSSRTIQMHTNDDTPARCAMCTPA